MAVHQAVRDNLTSKSVDIHRADHIGDGTFRTVTSGTFVGGNRNQQKAACKKFKPIYAYLEKQLYDQDFACADAAIKYAQGWNDFCELKREVTITRGDLKTCSNGETWLVEPFIEHFTKFTSNNGHISRDPDALALEAFVHYSYHRSGGQEIVCDLQGRYVYTYSCIHRHLCVRACASFPHLNPSPPTSDITTHTVATGTGATTHATAASPRPATNSLTWRSAPAAAFTDPQVRVFTWVVHRDTVCLCVGDPLPLFLYFPPTNPLTH